MLLNFSLDPDFGWHAALGQYFLDHGQVLRGDIFSWTMPGYIWGNSYVLYQVLVAGLLGSFGYASLIFVFCFLGALGFSILVRDLNFLTGLFTIFAAALSRANLGVRPHVFSFLFFAMLLLALEKKLYNKPIFAPVVFLFFAIWANLHRGFVFALLTLCTFVFLDFLQSKKISKWAVVSTIVSFAATFVTPFPLEVWGGGIGDDFRTLENLANVAEWFPTAIFFPINIFFALSGGVLVYLMFAGGKKLEPIWFVVAALAFAMAFIFVSLVSFWGAIFVFLVCRYFYIPKRFAERVSRLDRYFAGVIIVICVIAVGANFILTVGQKLSAGNYLDYSDYPVGALAYLKESDVGGKMFNEYHWGGYLIWQGEGRPVFIDGRMAGWRRDGVSILGDFVKISKGECETLRKYDVEVVLVRPTFNTVCFDGFSEVWRDDVARVLVKR